MTAVTATTCSHHKDLERAIRDLKDAAYSVEDAASGIPDASEWITGIEKDDRQEFADHLASIARMVHEPHDRFSWKACRHTVCVEIRALHEDILEVES
jgi:hypothetical protein